MTNSTSDVIIIGAGAAGLMCAATAGYRGKSVTVIDMGKKPGRKILISGGGRCNFTNQGASPENYLCQNPHFIKSALKRYSAQDFIDLVDRHGLEYHHKTLGQLFCDNSAQDLLDILLTECDWAGVTIKLRHQVLSVKKTNDCFLVHTSEGDYQAKSLVVASGGLTMPKLGATPIGYQIAEQFGLKVIPTSAALVPFTLHKEDKNKLATLSGISIDCIASTKSGQQFRENLLFTHRGLSGPAILQASSYWQPGQAITIDLLPDINLEIKIAQWLSESPKKAFKTLLATLLPKRATDIILKDISSVEKPVSQLTKQDIIQLTKRLKNWQISPNATEGFRTAEVTRGGVDTDELSSKTFESKKESGLYFIGEVIDVTGWLGGFNFQFCWASGVACGQAIS